MALIDLTLNVEERMMTTQAYWHSKVVFEPLGKIAKEGRNTHRITLGTHTGTHMDAPFHFLQDSFKIDEVDISLFIQPCALLNLTDKKEGMEITEQDLDRYGHLLNKVHAAALFTGWSSKWMTPGFYGLWPSLTEGAAHYLLEKGIRLLAMDVPSPDSAKMIQAGCDSPVHKILMQKGVILVEYLTNLDRINKEIFTLYAFPLKLKGLDGSPARVIAET